MSSLYRSILNVQGSESLLLDTYSGASVAYSLRKLSSSYSGSAIRVRRSSDNTEQNIGFVDGDLDTQSLLDFVGYNLLTYSEDISQSKYTKQALNTTGTPSYLDVETAPDGTLTGDKLIESTANSQHSIYQAAVLTGFTPGINHNLSVYLKAAERTKVKIICDIDGVGKSCILNLTDGTISSSTFVISPVVTSESNGWYRFSVTQTSNTFVASFAPRIMLINSLNQDSYLGDGISGVYVWGFQLTRTSDVRNYTKTGATANNGDGFVTRWYDQSGNANNSAQSVGTIQPQIVSSGTVLTNNSKPSIFLENQDSLSFTSLTPITTFTVAKIDTLNYAIHYVLFNNVSPSGYFYGGTFSGVNGLGIYDGTAKSITGEDTNTHLGYFNYNGTNYEVAKDGSAISNLASGSNFDLNYIGRQQTALTLNGQLQEIVIYPSTQSSNKSNIESNINTYYSIY